MKLAVVQILAMNNIEVQLHFLSQKRKLLKNSLNKDIELRLRSTSTRTRRQQYNTELSCFRYFKKKSKFPFLVIYKVRKHVDQTSELRDEWRQRNAEKNVQRIQYLQRV